jgi:hypothetical protein
MDRGEVGDKRGSKEMDRCPLTIPSTSQPLQIRLDVPNNFDRDQLKGHTFLTSCELYTLLTASDFPDDQTQIHWALSFCKTGHTATFTKHIVRQEIKTGKMVFTSWTKFMDEFISILCPENEVTTTLMTLKSDWYFQGRQNVDAYTDKFRELIALSGYTDLITVILKFCQGLHPTTQDKIVEFGTD